MISTSQNGAVNLRFLGSFPLTVSEVKQAFFLRERTPLSVVAYALYLYLSGLSLRRSAEAISVFVDRSYEVVREWLGALLFPERGSPSGSYQGGRCG